MSKISPQLQLISPAIKGYLLAIIATFFWSGNFIVARAFNQDILPISLAFWRWTIALISLTPFALQVITEDWNLIKKNLPYLALSGLSGVTIFNSLLYLASHTTQTLNLSLISTSSPIFVVIMSRLFYGELITLRRATGIMIVCIGILWLMTGGSLDKLLGISLKIGDLYMVLGALVFGGYTMLVKRKPSDLHLTSFAFSTFSLGLVFLLPFYALESWIYPPVKFNPSITLALIYIGVFSSVVSFLSWNKAITLIGPTRTALIYYLIPVFSGLGAWFFLGEKITISHLSSMCLIILGILITNSTEPVINKKIN